MHSLHSCDVVLHFCINHFNPRFYQFLIYFQWKHQILPIYFFSLIVAYGGSIPIHFFSLIVIYRLKVIIVNCLKMKTSNRNSLYTWMRFNENGFSAGTLWSAFNLLFVSHLNLDESSWLKSAQKLLVCIGWTVGS